MKKEDKNVIIDSLVTQLKSSKHFYIADASNMNSAATSKLRRKCFENKIELIVVKNTLFRKALEKTNGNYGDIAAVLKSNSAIMFCDTANIPARLIKDFRKENQKLKFTLKGAFVEEGVYIGDNQLDMLAALKSKNELIGDIIFMLQSPAQNVISALQSGKNTLAGVIKTLSDKKE
jgi:large subunit ribosomal protein L10